MLHRAGVIGDIHAEDVRLREALAFFAERNVDAILAVGDLVDGPGDAERVIALLSEHAVAVVRGNHDRWLLDDSLRALPDAHRREDLSEGALCLLRGLPATRDFETPHGALLLCHGLGDDDMVRLGPDDFGYALEVNGQLQALLAEGRYRFVVGGHTHRRMVRSFGELTVINAGTLYREHDPCVALVDFDEERVGFFEWVEGELSEVETHRLR